MNSSEAAIGGVLEEKVFLEISQDSQENICARVSFLMKLQACEIFKNTFFTEHFRAAASGLLQKRIYNPAKRLWWIFPKQQPEVFCKKRCF